MKRLIVVKWLILGQVIFCLHFFECIALQDHIFKDTDEGSGGRTSPPAPIVNTEPLAETGQTLRQEEQNLRMVQPAGGFANADRVVDTSLRQNLTSLNQFIEDCRRRLKEDPNDELAREYLSVAYQQKAELLSAMLDRGRSVN